jgi:hypothetical protein
MICLLSAARNDRFDSYQSPVATANPSRGKAITKICNRRLHHEGPEEHEVKRFENIDLRILRVLRALRVKSLLVDSAAKIAAPSDLRVRENYQP